MFVFGDSYHLALVFARFPLVFIGVHWMVFIGVHTCSIGFPLLFIGVPLVFIGAPLVFHWCSLVLHWCCTGVPLVWCFRLDRPCFLCLCYATYQYIAGSSEEVQVESCKDDIQISASTEKC